jgi:holo-[acyl-carrier-protein] synthase|tara:strand:- start:2894 stop:3214 length:321 start_codon:yes stop_codon:yes gene_type:complete
MKIKTGCDIVEIKRLSNLKKEALDKIFHKTELSNKPENLAGIFAAKEACKKVFNNLDWLDIEIKKKRTGKPILILNEKINNIISYDLSISHDKNYAIAVVVFLIKE